MTQIRPSRRRDVLTLTTLFFTTLCSAVGQAQVGQLLWEDNFDTFDTTVWTPDVGDGCDIGLCGWGNQELQWYAEDNVSIQPVPGEPGNNALVFEARNESINGYSFTSGKVTSFDKIAVQYGMIETRIRVPNVDQGLWPAAWLLGTSTQPWPNKGEIDMMEMGHRAEERERQGHPGVSSNSYTGSNLIFWAEAACVPGNPTCAASTAYEVEENKPYVSSTPMNDRFVIYRTYWTDAQVRFTVEDGGIEYDLYENPFIITPESNAFQAPFFFLLNMAVGGNFTDAAVPGEVTAPRPAEMYIDYVRVYEFNGQGEIFEGSVAQPEAGDFGVFTDNTPTDNKLEAGVTSDIYVWDPFSSEGTIAPYEGEEVITNSFNVPNNWFGGGVQTRQPRDMSNFVDGNLRFRINIPADIAFRIGVTDTFTNENWLTFPAFETTYGLVRDGDWGEVEIPISDLRGPLIALQSMQYLFAISSDPANFPSRTFEYAIDDIVWESDTVADTDSDNDGVLDSDDLCPNTPAGTPVDSDGCPVVVGGDSVEIGTVSLTQANSSAWTSVTFDESFQTTPMVVMGAATFNGSHAMAVRVRNVSTSGFEFQLDEWDYLDGYHTNETLSYIAVEEGTHSWGGLQITAGSLDVNTSWETASFAQNFNAAPMVLAQQVSDNDSTATTIRVRNVDAGGFQLKLQEEEAADDVHANESVDYVAVAYGEGSVNGMDVLVDSTGRAVNQSWYQIDFGASYESPQFLAGMQSQFGGDTATVRYSNLTDTSVSVRIHEEQSANSETNHTTENVGYILFGNESAVVVDSDNDGVPDSQDQCPNTPAGAEVDALGCEIIDSELTGVTSTGANTIEFFVNTPDWADVHYVVNGGPQLNVRMTQTGSRNVYTADNISSGDQVQFFFTYWDADGSFAVDTAWETYTH